jgi:hypothetical protein
MGTDGVDFRLQHDVLRAGVDMTTKSQRLTSRLSTHVRCSSALLIGTGRGNPRSRWANRSFKSSCKEIGLGILIKNRFRVRVRVRVWDLSELLEGDAMIPNLAISD